MDSVVTLRSVYLKTEWIWHHPSGHPLHPTAPRQVEQVASEEEEGRLSHRRWLRRRTGGAIVPSEVVSEEQVPSEEEEEEAAQHKQEHHQDEDPNPSSVGLTSQPWRPP
mmetsp:Transcript_100593/g.262837  ORF Transcript_100593/g.262837 Transcript_100593/m.262837 type:complete len:109 (+) Transcript_100593:323-649(+)